MHNKPTEHKQQYEYLSGNIERVTYHNQENGFAVLKVKVKRHKDLITVIGTLPAVTVGEDIQAQGTWRNNTEYGLEFKAEFIRSILPNTLEGIEKYLSSGLIRGIGDHFAKKLVAAFAEEVFEVIESSPERLSSIDGIGKKRVENIRKNWAEQKVVREIMIFLQSNGVGTSRATRIYKTYGEGAIKIVSEDPYRLSRDIKGIGFKSADKIAENLGIKKDSMIRARAGVNHTLLESMSDGHVALPKKLLLEKGEKLLTIPINILEEAIDLELSEGFIKKDLIGNDECIFLTAYYFYEKAIAARLKALSTSKPMWGEIDLEKAIAWVEARLNIKLAVNQCSAVKLALSSKLSVITGGPGTGKTTILNCIITILNTKGVRIKLCAPTGRAAKRLSETTGITAYTIHRLLKYEPNLSSFKYNQNNPLDCELLIVDESSMIDVSLMNSLLKALPDKAALIIVGDVDQLPAVGAGQVLRDMIDSEVVPTQKLTEIYRQAKGSDIIVNAHLVNKGIVPKLKPKDGETDFYFIEAEDIAEKIKLLVRERIPKKFKLDPIRQIQVLCPMQKGGCGARALNVELQKLLNPNYANGIEKYGQVYAVGDKVMQMENNYDKEVYNGDIGYVNSIDVENQELIIDFEGNMVSYDFSELDEVSLSYATTVHKSQGSEYPAVVMPISMQHFMMLKKNLLYTGITRGRSLVVLVGEKRAMFMAVKSKKSDIRYTKLKEWLVEARR